MFQNDEVLSSYDSQVALIAAAQHRFSGVAHSERRLDIARHARMSPRVAILSEFSLDTELLECLYAVCYGAFTGPFAVIYEGHNLFLRLRRVLDDPLFRQRLFPFWMKAVEDVPNEPRRILLRKFSKSVQALLVTEDPDEKIIMLERLARLSGLVAQPSVSSHVAVEYLAAVFTFGAATFDSSFKPLLRFWARVQGFSGASSEPPENLTRFNLVNWAQCVVSRPKDLLMCSAGFSNDSSQFALLFTRGEDSSEQPSRVRISISLDPSGVPWKASMKWADPTAWLPIEDCIGHPSCTDFAVEPH